jgi:hypothetical protein
VSLKQQDYDQARKVLRDAQQQTLERLVAFVQENEAEILSGPQHEYDSSGALERLNAYKDAFILFGVLISQFPCKQPETKECPECLERVPVAARRCRACASPLVAPVPPPAVALPAPPPPARAALEPARRLSRPEGKPSSEGPGDETS